ncbi:helicase-related protein, partial [Escherichia coli]|nr:helicase-related protein [Escherichia coli]
HASVSDEERHRALTVQAQRKVVLATNVAETSLTIPNIRVVIDSGLERRTVQRNGRTALTLTNISKASAAQRMGRAGRVAEGSCIRLFGEHR